MKETIKRRITKTEKDLTDRFNSLCQSRQSWQVWTDIITATACAIANSVDNTSCDFEARE